MTDNLTFQESLERDLHVAMWRTEINDHTVELYKGAIRGFYPQHRKQVIDSINQAYTEVLKEEAEKASDDEVTNE